jgi:hypothetical protein
MSTTRTGEAASITLGGEIAPDLALGCLTLEGCYDREGRLAPWAAQVLALFCLPESKGTTVRIPFVYRPSDLPEVPGGRMYDGYRWERAGAVLETLWQSRSAPPRHISIEQFNRLIREHGPAFAAGVAAAATPVPEPAASALADALLLEQVIKGVADGCPAAGGAPWSPQRRDRQPRSVRRLLRQHGVDEQVEPLLLQAMRARGVTPANFRRAKGDTRMGLRTAEGLPGVVWVD